MLVHASFAFVHAVERGADLTEPLRSCVDAIRECEALVLSGPVPACVVRLGYLYGPESADLQAYRAAFRLGRPYWSGPAKALQYHVHQFDAAAALLAAGKPRNEGKTLYATDGHAVSFTKFMDAFAHRVGRRNAAASAVVLEAAGQGRSSARNTCSKQRSRCRIGRRRRACRDGRRSSRTTGQGSIR